MSKEENSGLQPQENRALSPNTSVNRTRTEDEPQPETDVERSGSTHCSFCAIGGV